MLRRLVGILDDYLERTMIVILMTVLVFCLTYSSFVRYFVTHPFFTSLTHQSEELAVFAFIWMLYWGASLAAKENAHVRINAHFSLLPEKLQRWKYLPSDALWICFNVFIIWQGWVLLHSSIVRPDYSLSLGIHMAIIYAVIPLTFLATTVRLLQNIYRGSEDKETELV